MSSLELDRYRERLDAYKIQRGQGHIDRMKSAISDSFMKSPSYFKVLINDEPRDVQITEGLDGNNTLLPIPGEDINVGDIIKWKEKYFLCTNNRNNATVQGRGEIRKCNETLKWQDESGEIFYSPCILEDKTSVYSDGLSKTKYLSMGTDQLSILVQTNDQTRLIPPNKRFVFDNDPNNIYETNRKDSILNKGLSLFVSKKTLYDKNRDRLDLNLADYRDVKVEVPPENTSGETVLFIEGKTSLTVWDENEEFTVNTSEAVNWSLNRSDLLSVSDYNENKCYISSCNVRSIGETVLRVELIENPAIFAEKTLSTFYQ